MSNKNPHLKIIFGYTLIEVLVVLFIITIITAVAAFSIHLVNPRRTVTLMTQQLVNTIKSAEQEALLRNAVLGLQFTQHGYQFYQFQGQWKKLTHDRLSQPQAWKNDVLVQLLQLENKNMSGLSKSKSYVIFSSSGDISPFKIMITDRRRDRAYQVSGEENGAIHFHEVHP